jgi:hypothetical protein
MIVRSVSDSVRQKRGLILRRAVHDCAPVQLRGFQGRAYYPVIGRMNDLAIERSHYGCFPIRIHLR